MRGAVLTGGGVKGVRIQSATFILTVAFHIHKFECIRAVFGHLGCSTWLYGFWYHAGLTRLRP